MKKSKYFFFLIIFGLYYQTTNTQFYSQNNQDQFIYEQFFKDDKKGFFIDIGANDGITYSNTYFFEKHLGWKGICFEPLPSAFKILQKNRSCTCINACIGSQEELAQFLAIQGITERTDMLSGLIKKYDPRHIERINRELALYGGTKKIIVIPCYTLNTILEKYDIRYIDYLSIDTEGGELDILKSIDFSKIIINIIDVENNYNEPYIYNYLLKKGYQLVKRTGADEIYKKINL
ncbi:MAG: FkbM family methyltransferase [Candidatus Babeliales bacterium]